MFLSLLICLNAICFCLFNVNIKTELACVLHVCYALSVLWTDVDALMNQQMDDTKQNNKICCPCLQLKGNGYSETGGYLLFLADFLKHIE